MNDRTPADPERRAVIEAFERKRAERAAEVRAAGLFVCGAKYAGDLTCRRLAGHEGTHRVRPTVKEFRAIARRMAAFDRAKRGAS